LQKNGVSIKKLLSDSNNLKSRRSAPHYPPSATKIKAETTLDQATRSPQGRKASASALAA
ncbi:hypothetical protein, partial [Alloprevotella tannerae]|uniref:hypothetical protein n=1 Tax=Alloprevotella tannerae TaxID=76122 RepID=UPI0028E534FC